MPTSTFHPPPWTIACFPRGIGMAPRKLKPPKRNGMLAHPSNVDRVLFNPDTHLVKRGRFARIQANPYDICFQFQILAWPIFVLYRMITSTLCIRKGRHCFTQRPNQYRSMPTTHGRGDGGTKGYTPGLPLEVPI
ncbi:hypothetical protein CGRA01v4_07686 [Colletotrichum graminicola]|nr:hypothetical protein CGRA01v4_07686 [Colletotrichum graminicola]